MKRWLFGCIALLMFSLSVSAQNDTLPAGTKIQLTIQQPGAKNANHVTVTIPAPVRIAGKLYDGDYLGKRGTDSLVAKLINGKLYVAQLIGQGRFLVRGTNLLKNDGTSVSAAPALTSQLAPSTTDWGGLSEPPGISTPAGYSRLTFPDGAVYYAPSGNTPGAVKQNPDVAENAPVPSSGQAGSGTSGVQVPTANTTPSPIPAGAALQVGSVYIPEPVGVFNPAQFGLNKKYSDNFKFGANFNPSQTPDQRKAYGVSLFEPRDQTEADRAQMRFGDGFAYFYEHQLFDGLLGNRLMEASLEQVYQTLWNTTISAGSGNVAFVSKVAFNIEQSIWWAPGETAQQYPGFSAYSTYGQGHNEFWADCKDRVILCESDGIKRTVEQLAQLGEGYWNRELSIRRANRLVLMMLVAKEKAAPGVQFAFGSAIYQGVAATKNLSNTSVFLPEYADVNQIGGKNGVITLKRPGGSSTYKIDGNVWQHEDWTLDYYYRFNFDIAQADWNVIWRLKTPNTQTYPYLWSKIQPIHVVADEKGRWQLTRARQVANGGVRGIIRMPEIPYEANDGGVVGGQWGTFQAARINFDQLQNAWAGGEMPKVFQPPYINYSAYLVHRFLEGGTANSGFLLWNAPPRFDLAAEKQYNAVHLHSVTSVFQARNDLQPYEEFLGSSTLIENPPVQINAQGDFVVYDGTTAHGYDGNGGWATPKPAYMIRYQKQDDNTYVVMVLGGMKQGYTDTRTDKVRIDTGPLSGTVLEVSLYGPAAQAYVFRIKGAGSYKSPDPLRPPAGYAGFIVQP